MSDADIPEFPLGTKEYVRAVLTSDRDLVAQPLELKVNGAWLPATFTGSSTPGTSPEGVPIWTRPCRTSSIVDFTAAEKGFQTIYARFTDTPEVPIIDCGPIKVTA